MKALLTYPSLPFRRHHSPSSRPICRRSIRADDVSPMMLGFLLIGLCLALFLFGVGIVLAAIVAASAGIMIALGIISSAALVGLLQRRLSAGLRAFHYQILISAASWARLSALDCIANL